MSVLQTHTKIKMAALVFPEMPRQFVWKVRQKNRTTVNRHVINVVRKSILLRHDTLRKPLQRQGPFAVK